MYVRSSMINYDKLINYVYVYHIILLVRICTNIIGQTCWSCGVSFVECLHIMLVRLAFKRFVIIGSRFISENEL